MLIRTARDDDAAALHALAMRSKAVHGYDVAFMRVVRTALEPDARALRDGHTFVAEIDGATAGFYAFSRVRATWWLNDFWLDPPFIGSGRGRELWEHALASARAIGIGSFAIESDPNAEGFYRAMGARRLGTRRSAPTGRDLPLLRYDLTAS